jgi:hypothetical protein
VCSKLLLHLLTHVMFTTPKKTPGSGVFFFLLVLLVVA